MIGGHIFLRSRPVEFSEPNYVPALMGFQEKLADRLLVVVSIVKVSPNPARSFRLVSDYLGKEIHWPGLSELFPPEINVLQTIVGAFKLLVTSRGP